MIPVPLDDDVPGKIVACFRPSREFESRRPHHCFPNSFPLVPGMFRLGGKARRCAASGFITYKTFAECSPPDVILEKGAVDHFWGQCSLN